MPLLETKGAASAQGFGLTLQQTAANYIEDVFSTWLYTGNGGTTQTINNGIDLTGKGGMVWVKNRTTAGTNPTTSSYGVNNHFLFDTARTNQNALCSSAAVAQDTTWGSLYFNFLANGFDTGTGSSNAYLNASNQNYATWTFRKQPKFFDVVTYTGDGSSTTNIPHSLGSAPGCVICKSTSTTEAWGVWHRGNGTTSYGSFGLNSSAGASSLSGFNSHFTSTTFRPNSVRNATAPCNQVGVTYVAYLFAHNAGGFGLTGTDNVISCGSFTTDGSGNATVSLGYEPQWIMIKGSTSTSGWGMFDNMRGLPVGGADAYLFANSSAAEATFNNVDLTATGFNAVGWGASTTYIYIAIRRGPMKTPTTGTSVFGTDFLSSTGTNPNFRSSFPVDFALSKNVNNGSPTLPFRAVDRLRGATSTGFQTLVTSTTAAEVDSNFLAPGFAFMNGWASNGTNTDWESWMFRRAPGFFDVVCYTGTGNVGSDATRITHNLGVAPELIIVKGRTNSVGWPVYSATLGVNIYLLVNTTDASSSITGLWATTAPTATTFGVSNGGGGFNNGGGVNYVAYLFASCPGVSKVGSYTGTGALQTVNCGFTGGARFVLIKRTDSAGDWWLYDSARGITSGNDPYLFLNTTDAQVTNTNYVDTTSVGFQVTAAAPAGLNANGGTFIFLAIA